MLVVWIVTYLIRFLNLITRKYLKIMSKFNSLKFKQFKITQKLNISSNINVFVDQYIHINMILFIILNRIVKKNIKVKNLFTSNPLNILRKIVI